MSDAKLQRTIARFQAKIDSGEFYEAHQTLRTITNRYVKSKQYNESIDLLYQGAAILSKNKEYGSSSDLITYLIQVYEEAGIECNSDNKQYKNKLIELVNYLPDTEPSLPDLAKQAINWSTISTGEVSKFGDNSLHHIFGIKFLNRIKHDKGLMSDSDKTKLYSVTELHLILGTYDSLPPYVDFLYQWYKQQTKISDPGVFLARAVINYSYLKNIKFVNDVIDKFLSKLTSDNSEFEVIDHGDKITYYHQFPIITFLQLLAIILSKEASGDKFLKLYNQFKPILAQNELTNPVEYLGRTYFGLKLGNPQGGQNMLANLMGGLFK